MSLLIDSPEYPIVNVVNEMIIEKCSAHPKIDMKKTLGTDLIETFDHLEYSLFLNNPYSFEKGVRNSYEGLRNLLRFKLVEHKKIDVSQIDINQVDANQAAT